MQGGGAHGAFTWGVLDRLLEEADVEIGWTSGTSAGALNAVALVSGLATGGRRGARDTLRLVWEAIEKAGVPDFLRLNPFVSGFARNGPLSGMPPMFSPYEFNPMGFDPLRRLLTQNIAFDKIRAASPFEVLIAATDVTTGRAQIFRRSEITVETVLASACLPTLHHAVEINGRAYWDGGFSANPDLLTIAAESPIADTLIIQLNQNERNSIPRTSSDIAAHVSSITFNQPFLRDIELVVAAQAEKIGWLPLRNGRLSRIGHHRFHLVEAGRYTASLSAESKVKLDRGLLSYLFASGRAEINLWLEKHRGDIGRRQTVDLRQRYLEPRSAARDTPEPDAEPGRETPQSPSAKSG